MTQSPIVRPLFIGGVSIALLTLSSCGEEEKQAQVFESEIACKAEASLPDSWWTIEECEDAFSNAETNHINNAPRYKSLSVCEQEHGSGQCGTDRYYGNSSHNTSFTPMMAGYFMGRSSDTTQTYQTARPLYSAASGGYSSANGNAKFSSLSGAKTMPASSFKPASVTLGKPPMSKAQAVSRGGFGSAKMTRTSRSSGGFRAGS
jgi:uncharacterized protein YgiB involved in biofilm formation